MANFTPFDWFWVVGGDASRAWSSAASSYVTSWDAGKVTRIANEQELLEVLRAYGLRGPYVSATDLKAEAQKRIILLTKAQSFDDTIVKQLNALMRAIELTLIKAKGGEWTKEEEAEVLAHEQLAAQIKAIRAKSNELEKAIPADYTLDRHWEG